MQTTSQEDDYKFQILYEEVSDKDEFEYNTHEGVATTLYELIRDTDKGITVGLEGAWGSGKSTVINLLRNKLDEKTLFFSFDAWAHEGDPLRRIFLESLINKIDPNNENDELVSLKNKVSGRTKTVDVKTKKGVSKFGKLISASALAIPMGSAFLSAVKYENLVYPWSDVPKSIDWLLVFGIFLTLLPLVVTLGCWLLKRDEFKLFESESAENYTQDITEDGERTSIEFERLFSEIMSLIIGKPDSKYERCIIVIDNLDRIEAKSSQGIWSTLQTFFQHRSSSNSHLDWKDKLWFIVPFDREGLSKIWQQEDSNSDMNVARSFFDKCFQVIAEVPTPVMSGWIKFFDLSLEKAFSNRESDWKNEFRATYIRCKGILDSSPTPREIYTLINKSGFLSLQFKNSISAQSICIYSLLRLSDTEKTIRKMLLENTISQKYSIDGDLNKVKSEIAGLLFKVEPQKGIELLLVPEIRQSLINGDGGYLNSLIKDHNDSFWISWDKLDFESLFSSDNSDKIRINVTKALHNGMIDFKSHIIKDINHLYKIWSDDNVAWDFKKYKFSESLSFLYSLVQDKNNFGNWLSDFSQNIISQIVSSVSDDFDSEELSSLSDLEHFIRANNINIKSLHYRNLDLPNWKIWIEALKKENVKFHSIHPTKGTIKELSEKVLSSSSVNEDDMEILFLSYINSPIATEWKLALPYIVSWSKLSNRTFYSENFYKLVKILIIDSSENIKKELISLINSKEFWSSYVTNEDGEDISTLSILAGLCIDDFDTATFLPDEIKEYWANETNEQVHIIEDFVKAKQLGNLWKLATDSNNKLARAVLLNSNDDRLYETIDCIRYLGEFDDFDEKHLENLVSRICKLKILDSNNDIRSVIRGDFLAYSKVLEILQKHGDTGAKEFVTSILKELSKENWGETLEKENKLFALLEHKERKLSCAVLEYMKNIVSGDREITQWFSDNISGILEKSADVSRIIFTSVSEAFFSCEKDNLSDDIFSLLKDYMSVDMLNKSTQEDIEKKLLLWLENKQFNRAKWLLSLDRTFDTLLLTDSLPSVIEEIRAADEDNQHDELYSNFEKMFNFKLNNIEKESD